MNKFVDFLEKQCQWIALGLGGLWLLYMVYAYVLNGPSSSVEVAGQSFSPARVDEHVFEEAAIPLRDAMNKSDKLLQPKLDTVSAVRDTLNLVGEQPVLTAGNYLKSSVGMTLGGGQDEREKGPKLPVALINALPVPPAPINPEVITGMSIVGNAGPADPAGAGGQRVLWNSVFATVPMKDLAAQFEPFMKLPPNPPSVRQTMFLKVEIEREEQLLNGTWAKRTIIVSQPVDLGQAAAGAGPAAVAQPNWPANDPRAQMDFNKWAALNQRVIAQPAFYNVTKGDGWHRPGEAGMEVGGAPAIPVDAAPPPVAPPVANPPRRNPPAQPPRRPRNGAGAERGDATPRHTDSVIYALQLFSEEGMTTPPTYNPTQQGANNAQNIPLPPANKLGEVPAQPFVPAAAADVLLWVHDTNVESGKSYRYRMRYALVNPIFQFKNFAQPVDLANKWVLESGFSIQSSPVTVRDTTTYYFTQASIRPESWRNEGWFEIFTWNVGGVQKKTVQKLPGDQLDDTVRLTLVDLREIGNDRVATLVDDAGTIVTRSWRNDSNDPNLAKMRTDAGTPQAPLPGPGR